MLAVSAYFVLFVAAAEGINDFLPELIASNYGDAFTVFGVPVTAESTASSYYSAVLVIAAFAQVGTGALVE